MPNFDAGHYFLTVLLPLRDGTLELSDPESGGTRVVSHRQRVTELLAALPNGEWRPVPALAGAPHAGSAFSPCSRSPFRLSPRTHFTRWVVIDDLPWNGRQPHDTLLGALFKRDPLVGQPVEHLNQAWLLWTADFDAASAADGELDSWLAQLWQVMAPELTSLLEHAVAFETVCDADSFVHYIRRCQIETTLPFNDYWTVPPPLADVAIKPPIAIAVVGAVLLLLALLLMLGLGAVAALDAAWPGSALVLPPLVGQAAGWALMAGAPLLLIGLGWLWLAITRAAARPFPAPTPPAPDSTLSSVLKALHVQAHFVEFAAATQGLDAPTLHSRFAEFLAQHRPDELARATQAPAEPEF